MFSYLTNKFLSYRHSSQLPPSATIPQFQPIFKCIAATKSWKSSNGAQSSSDMASKTLQVLTWNVDFGSPEPRRRLNALLSFLENQNRHLDIVLLQEVNKYALDAIVNHPWVQFHFSLTDIDSTAWNTSFRSVTLLNRCLAPGATYRLDLPSRMDRGALICDIHYTSTLRLRIINVHLDSLPINPPRRPAQLALVADHLRAQGAGLIAGDFNAITLEDATLSEDLGLSDAWVSIHGGEGGHTWGIQKTEPFPPGRLDRVVYLDLRPTEVKVIDCGKVRLDDEEEIFWSDHCGLQVEFQVTDN